jgi:CRISPR/Cas system-associated endonuclease Cas1
LIIQNVGVAITAALLSKLMEAKVKVIFCDPKSNPQGELVSYYDNSGISKNKSQLSWQEADKNRSLGGHQREKKKPKPESSSPFLILASPC